MQRKRWFVFLAVALIAALLFGCSAPARIGQDAEPETNPGAPSQEQTNSNKGGSDAGGGLPAIDPGKAAQAGKKIVYTAEIVIQAESAEKAANSIIDKAAEIGGYLADSYVAADNRNAESYITVRIPPEKLKEFTAFVGTLGKGVSRKVDSQDVTDQYYDVQSRLTNAQAQEAQYLELMKQAVKIEDILAVRQRLDEVQQEIEQYKGQIRLMDNQVGFATVKILIHQPPAPAVVVEDKPDPGVQFWGFAAIWQKISRAFSDGFNWTLNAISSILMVLAYAVLPLIFVGAVTLGIIALVRACRKWNLKRKQAGARK